MRKPIFLALILVILSCQSKTSKNAESNTEMEIIKPKKLVLNDTIVYLSGDNDLALIKLTLIPNGTFLTQIIKKEMNLKLLIKIPLR